MKRTILFLISALVVFLGTLFITNNYMTSESVEEADRINDLLVDEVRSRMDVNLIVREKSVHSFLSGLLKYEITEKDGVTDTLITFREGEIQRFPDYVYNILNEFMKLNPHIIKALFVVDSSVFPGTGPNGFAPCIMSGDSTHYDLAKEYDFMHSETYKILKKTGDCIWRLPHEGSPLRGETVTYFVPIHRESGAFFGYFAINMNLNLLREDFTKALPYGKDKSAVIITNENNEIILSTDSFYNKLDKVSDITRAFAHDKTFHKEVSDSVHHDVFDWQGEKYFVYHSKLERAPWHALTICEDDAIYKGVNKTRNVILIVSLIGMLIMFACCLVIFRHTRENLKRKLAVENELNMAAKVQMSMLKPQRFTMKDERCTVCLDAFIKPAREAGGDLYDYIEKDGKLIFCIGDVSGKGMPAALYMSQVVSLFRNAVRCDNTPEKIIYDMNNVLSESNPDMTFCTCIVGVVDNDSITCCNAGHNPPIMIHGSRVTGHDCVQPLTMHPNIALGLMEGFNFKPDTIPFSSSDSLLLYTDGVTEAKNISHEQFGEERLIDALTKRAESDELCSLVYDSVKHFVDKAPQSDDITILTISK